MLQKADNRNGVLEYSALINKNKSYFYIIFLMGTISLACNDMTPEQMATNVNCSSPERHTRSYDYMEGGDVRVRRLFCRTQWYMRIDKRGKVKGTREANNNYSKHPQVQVHMQRTDLHLEDYRSLLSSFHLTLKHFLIRRVPDRTEKYWDEIAVSLAEKCNRCQNFSLN
ncbi:fibroblast growth factor 7 isoform X4 [Accipiter gentilis]|uniref:fibroblast growth factor 7 isoform X4 n=1 Tax=Astur gentilis TaxID=8957 RepID=UPI002110DD8C|nr:fibroblast growth factor 7 isoform X4 [Accipiter gentilis]